MVVIALILTMVALPIEIAFFSEEETHEETKKDDGGSTIQHDTAAATAANGSTVVQGLVHEGHIYEGINLFAEVIFVTDIILNFRTGYVFKEMDQVQGADGM